MQDTMQADECQNHNYQVRSNQAHMHEQSTCGVRMCSHLGASLATQQLGSHVSCPAFNRLIIDGNDLITCREQSATSMGVSYDAFGLCLLLSVLSLDHSPRSAVPCCCFTLLQRRQGRLSHGAGMSTDATAQGRLRHNLPGAPQWRSCSAHL